MIEEPLFCPFCKAEARVYEAGEGPVVMSAYKYNIECFHLPECPIGTSGEVVGDLCACSDNFEKLIKAWNRRAERTCRDLTPDSDALTCSECGAESFGQVHTKPYIDVFSYCQNCGARVVDE